MAPEIISKKTYFGGPTDIWALGVILYTLLTGAFPFKGSSESELFSRIRQGMFKIPDGIPFTARKLISRMLSLDPIKRPTASELYYDEWIRGDTKYLRKMTLRMINDQFSQNPLAKIIQENNLKPRSLLSNKKDWRPKTRSFLINKRNNPEFHLQEVNKITNPGYNLKQINDRLGEFKSNINRMNLHLIK